MHLPSGCRWNSRNGPHTGIHISSDNDHDEQVEAVVQRPVGDRGVHDAGTWVTITTALNATPATTGLAQPGQHPVPAPVADRAPAAATRGVAMQHERRQEVRQHHVLHHVRRVEVLLGDVVQRPVARRPQHDHRRRRRAILLAGDHRRAGGHGLRADHAHHVDVRPGEEGDEEPHLGVPLERQRDAEPLGRTWGVSDRPVVRRRAHSK